MLPVFERWAQVVELAEVSSVALGWTGAACALPRRCKRVRTAGACAELKERRAGGSIAGGNALPTPAILMRRCLMPQSHSPTSPTNKLCRRSCPQT